jgi:tetratricopeptide (TPR) repeat protein
MRIPAKPETPPPQGMLSASTASPEMRGPTPGDKPTLGQRLKEARRALGLTQDALGGADFTKGFISLLEHDRARPSVASLERIAARLGRPVSYFLEGDQTALSSKVVEVLRSRGGVELARGSFATAVETFREMRRLAAGRHDDTAELAAAVGEGEALARAGRIDEARPLLEQACRRAGEAGAVHLECRARHRLAQVELGMGRHGRALALFRAALDAARTLDGAERSFVGEIQLDYGAALSRAGRLDDAAEMYREAGRLFEETTRPDRAGEALYGLGRALADGGDYDGAMRQFERARGLLEQHEDLRRLARVREETGTLLMRSGRPAEAVPHFAACLEAMERVQDAAGACRTLIEFARCLAACGEAVRAGEVGRRAVSRSREAGRPDDEARALAVVGSLAAAARDLKEAQRALAAAAEHCEAAGMSAELVGVYKGLGQVAALQGRYKDAARHHERAFALLQNLGPADIPSVLQPPPVGAATPE